MMRCMWWSKNYEDENHKKWQEYSNSLKNWIETAESMSPPEEGWSLINELMNLLSKFDKAINKPHYKYKKINEMTCIIDLKWYELWLILQRMRGTQHAGPK